MNPFALLLKFVPMPYVIGASVVFLMTSHGYVWFKGREAGLEKYYEFKSSVEQAMGELHRQNEAEHARRTEEAARNADQYDSALGTLARSYNSRLAGLRSVCDRREVPGHTAAQPAPNGAADELVLGSGSFEAECLATEKRAAHDAAQVIFLQDYIQSICLKPRRKEQ